MDKAVAYEINNLALLQIYSLSLSDTYNSNDAQYDLYEGRERKVFLNV